MVFSLAIGLGLSLFSVPAAAYDAEDASFHRALAAHHAPVIAQGIGSKSKADVFTRFDFDGDLNADNNWKNLDRVATVGAYVYFDVIEAKNHWFITYGLFYPRDYDLLCFWKLCHENDFEGMRLTVEKRADEPFGELVLLETLAHNRLRFDEGPARVERRAVVVVERGGHGIYSWNQRRPDKKSRVYTYRGNPFVKDGYDLIPMSELWNIRGEVGRGKAWTKTFTYQGERFAQADLPAAFGGNKWGRGFARPPWAWSPSQRGLKKGDWFFDPIQSLCHMRGCLPGTDGTYVFNPYAVNDPGARAAPPSSLDDEEELLSAEELASLNR